MFSRGSQPGSGGPRTRWSAAWGLLFLLAAFSARGRAQSVVDPLSALAEKWRWVVFDVDEGLSSGAVSFVYSSVHDQIYAATDRGLCRYDFHFWDVIENPGPFDTGNVVRIVESADYVYCATRTVLWVIHGDKRLFRVYPEPGSPPERAPEGIFVASGPSGQVFLVDKARGPRGVHLRILDTAISPVSQVVQLPLGKIRDYQIDARGVHWLVTEVGVFTYDPESPQAKWGEASGPPGSECIRLLSFREPLRRPATALARLAERNLWGVFRQRGAKDAWFLARADGDIWERLPEKGLSGAPVKDVAVDMDGNVFATCEDGRLLLLPAGKVQWSKGWRHVTELGREGGELSGICVDPKGHLWFLRGSGGVALFDIRSQRWRKLPGFPIPNPPSVLSLLETTTGELWVGTAKGVYRYERQSGEPLSEAQGEPPPYLFRDPTPYEDAAGTPLEQVTALAEEYYLEGVPGTVWIGSQSPDVPGAYYFDLESGEKVLPETDVPIDVPIHRIVRDDRRELWFLPEEDAKGDTRNYVYRHSISTGRRLVKVLVTGAIVDRLQDRFPVVNDLLRTGNSEVWLATGSAGLWRCQLNGTSLDVKQQLDETNGLYTRDVWSVSEGAGDGAIWVCYRSSGVTRIKDDVFTHFDKTSGLASSEVWSLTRSDYSLWFGTRRGGLSRYDGQCWYSFPVASADADSSNVYPLLVPRKLGTKDSLIVGTLDQGVWLYQGDYIRKPKIHADSIREFPKVADRRGRITFRWRARDYKDQTLKEDLIFRYRLDGGPWQTERGVDSVTFENLSIGSHVFYLQVRDLDGFRNWKWASHEFSVEPGTSIWPFAAGGLTLGGAMVVFLVLAWNRSVRRRNTALRQLRGFYLSHPDGVLLVDRTGRVCDYNGRHAPLLGLSGFQREDVIGRPVRAIPALSSADLDPSLAAAFRGRNFHLRGIHRPDGTGTDAILEISGFPLRQNAERAARAGDWEPPSEPDTGVIHTVVIVVEDVTDRTEEADLVAREKRLQGLRTLACRLSTELEKLFASLEQAGRRDATGQRDPVLDEQVQRLQSTVARLMAFSRPPRDADVAGSVEVDVLLESLLPASGTAGSGGSGLRFSPQVRVDYRSQTGLWPARAEDDILREALVAVLRNASQAMPEQGHLTIRAVNLRLDEDPGRLPKGSYVELTVRDDGPGIDPAQLDAIFDPFHSTKPRDLAEGLGLSVAYGLVRSQGGDVRVSSRLGRGTTVKIWLPAARA